MRLFQLEDVRDALKIFSRVDVVGREIDQDLFTSRGSGRKMFGILLRKNEIFTTIIPQVEALLTKTGGAMSSLTRLSSFLVQITESNIPNWQ